jgi:hypothetical protein
MKISSERLARAKQLLHEIHHVSIATANDDGTPHNSPVFTAFDSELNAYWASHMQTRHSQNIGRDGKVFMVIFDSREGHGGVFIEAYAEPLRGINEAAHGLAYLRQVRETLGGTIGDITYFTDEAPQRIYRATPTHIWVNQSDRDERGNITGDRRIEIQPEDLLR